MALFWAGLSKFRKALNKFILDLVEHRKRKYDFTLIIQWLIVIGFGDTPLY